MFRTKVVQKIKTRCLCSVTFFFENRTVFEIMWKNIVERGRPQMAIWGMRIACWVTKATDKHSEYITRIAFPRQQWLRERAAMFKYVCAYLCCQASVGRCDTYASVTTSM